MSRLLVIGNPIEGHTFVGPFEDGPDAIGWAEVHAASLDWWVCDLLMPSAAENRPEACDVAAKYVELVRRNGTGAAVLAALADESDAQEIMHEVDETCGNLFAYHAAMDDDQYMDIIIEAVTEQLTASPEA